MSDRMKTVELRQRLREMYVLDPSASMSVRYLHDSLVVSGVTALDRLEFTALLQDAFGEGVVPEEGRVTICESDTYRRRFCGA